MDYGHRLVEEEPAARRALGRIVGLPVDVLLEVRCGREGARVGEVGRDVGLLAHLGVDLLGQGGVHDALGDDRVLEDLDRVLGPAVLLDLRLGAVGVVGVRDGMAPVPVRVDLDDRGPALLAGLLEERRHDCFSQ